MDQIATSAGPQDPDDLDNDGCIYADPVLCDNGCSATPWHPECADPEDYCAANPDDPQCQEPDICETDPQAEECQPLPDEGCPEGFTTSVTSNGTLLCTRSEIQVVVQGGGTPGDGGSSGPTVVNVNVDCRCRNVRG